MSKCGKCGSQLSTRPEWVGSKPRFGTGGAYDPAESSWVDRPVCLACEAAAQAETERTHAAAAEARAAAKRQEEPILALPPADPATAIVPEDYGEKTTAGAFAARCGNDPRDGGALIYFIRAGEVVCSRRKA
jgi:hypothetical protein